MRALLLMVFMFSLSCWAAPSNPPTPSAAPSAAVTDTKAAEREHAKEKATDDRVIAVSTALLAAFTLGLMFYTARLWGITKVLAGGAKQSSEQQLRAYVFAGHDSPITLHKEKFPSAQIDVKNFGQTPANEVICRAYIGVYPYPLTTALDLEDAPNPSKSPLAPSQTIKQFPTLESALTKPHLDAILAKQAAIYVWGEITYIDIFKTPRHTIFCLYCTGEDIDGGRLAYYHEGNDAT